MDFKPIVAGSDAVTGSPKKKRRYTCKQTQHEYIKRWRSSNLSQSKFCRQNNLNPKSLSRWLSAEVVVPVTPASASPLNHPVSDSKIDTIEIKFADDACIQVTGNLTADLLKQLLAEVTACK